MKNVLLITSLLSSVALSYAAPEILTTAFVYEDAKHLVRETVNNNIVVNEETQDVQQIITIDSITLSGKDNQNQVCQETLHSNINNQDLLEYYQTRQNPKVQNFLCNSSVSINFCFFSISTPEVSEVLVGQLPLTQTYIQPNLNIAKPLNINGCKIDKTTQAIILETV